MDKYQINVQSLSQVNWKSFNSAAAPGKRRTDGASMSLKFFGYVEKEEPKTELILREIDTLITCKGVGGVIRLEEVLNDSIPGHLSNTLPKQHLKSFPIVVTETIKSESLLERVLSNSSNYTEQMASSVFRRLIIALSGCHERDILIRSFSINSFGFASDSEESLRLIDFSNAVKLYGREAHFDTLTGLPEFLAPETLTHQLAHKQAVYSKASDVWQAGCVLYMLLHAKYPFGEQKEVIRQLNLESRILKGQFVDEINDLSVSDEAKNLLQRMLATDPTDRVSAAEVLKHPWITNSDSLPSEEFSYEFISRLKSLVSKTSSTSSTNAGPSLSLPVPSMVTLAPDTKMFQVICPGFKIPVRSEPNPSAPVLYCLASGAVVYVLSKSHSGYYQLADKPGYFNKNTKNLQLIETAASAAASVTCDPEPSSPPGSVIAPQQPPVEERFLSRPSSVSFPVTMNTSNTNTNTNSLTSPAVTETSNTNLKPGEKICGHRCSLAVAEKCCACSDLRPVQDKYEEYVDGEGVKFTDKSRGEYYCPECRALCKGQQKESWELVQDMRAAGKTIQKVHTAGYGLKDIKKAGYTLDEILYSNLYEEWELRKGGYTAAELHAAGFTAEQLKTAGYANDELTELGFDQETLWRIGEMNSDY